MKQTRETKPTSLDLEVTEVERRRKPGCSSSSTSPHCTCPVYYPGDVLKK